MIRALQKHPKKAKETSPGITAISSEAKSETIQLTTDFKQVHPLNSGQPQQDNPATAITIDDFDEEDVTNAYGALLESGAMMIADVEVTLNEDRIKRRGKQIFKIMKKYNMNFEYMDLMFVGVGVVGDCINVYQQTKTAKPEQGGEAGTTTPPATTGSPQDQQGFKELQAKVKI